MAKLVASKGRIDAVTKFEVGTLSVSFRRTAIAMTGDLGEISISDGKQNIQLTYAQGLSLAHEIMRRC